MDVWRAPDGGPVHLAGTLDVRSVSGVRAVLDAALDEALRCDARDVVLDLSELDGLDAAGLGLVVTVHRRARRAERRLVLRGARPAVLRTLAVTRLHRVLDLERLVGV